MMAKIEPNPRERIIQAATAVLGPGELGAAKVAALAKYAQVGRKTFYDTFPCGLDEVIRVAFEDAGSQMRRAAESQDWDWAEENRDVIGTVLLIGPQIDLPRLYKLVDETAAEWCVSIAGLSGALRIAAKRLRDGESLSRPVLEDLAMFVEQFVR